MFVSGLLEGGIKVVAANLLPEISAFFRTKHAKGVGAQKAQEELDAILFQPEDTPDEEKLTDEQKVAMIRSEAGASIAEMNATNLDVQSRVVDPPVE